MPDAQAGAHSLHAAMQRYQARAQRRVTVLEDLEARNDRRLHEVTVAAPE